MITDNLYSEILLKPLESNPNTLYIVSGYASVAMVTRHLEDTPEELAINLIIGMVGKEGLNERTHSAFQSISNHYKGRFTCRYFIGEVPVHAKCYAWFDNQVPLFGYIGSANYSINAFLASQKETVTEDDPIAILSYYNTLLPETINCLDVDVNQLKEVYNSNLEKKIKTMQNQKNKTESVTLSLLASDGQEVQRKAGLNWGQRDNRNPNQAYIAVPSIVSKTGFFPEKKHPFILLTDDEEALVCVTAQDNNKAIETKDDNSILGAYFRKRIGLPSGSPVRKIDLLSYGRTDITITKIDDETYHMDFSV